MIRAMDPQRFQAAYRRLQNLDERLTHKVRPRSRTSLSHATHEQLENRVRDLSDYVLELKEIVDDMFQAIAAAPPKPQRQSQSQPQPQSPPAPEGGG